MEAGNGTYLLCYQILKKNTFTTVIKYNCKKRYSIILAIKLWCLLIRAINYSCKKVYSIGTGLQNFAEKSTI